MLSNGGQHVPAIAEPGRAFARAIRKVEQLIEDRREVGWDQLKKMVLYFLLMRRAVPRHPLFPRLLGSRWFLGPIRPPLGATPRPATSR